MTSELLKGLLAANLAAACAILLVLAVRGAILRRFGAPMAYRLWLVPPLAALAVFLPAPAGMSLSKHLPTSGAESVFWIEAPGAPLRPAVVAKPDSSAAIPDGPSLLLGIWLRGVALSALLTLAAHRRGMLRFGALRPSAAGVMRAANHGLGPALVGVVRPRLVLPADFETRFEPREQTLILAHERHHSRSGDPAINALVVLLGCINWFNPLVHLAANRLRVDQELACDAAVVARFPGERRTYGQALLKSQLVGPSLPLGCTWPGRSPQRLQERLTMLAFDNPGRARLVTGSGLVGVLCFTAAAAAWAAAASTSTSNAPRAPAAVAAPAAAPTTPALASAPAAEVTPASPAPTRINMGCLANTCGTGSSSRTRDAAAVAAAISAGDAKAVMAAGGSAMDVVSAWLSADAKSGNPTLYGAETLAQRGPVANAQFTVRGAGMLSVAVDFERGGRLIISRDLDGVAIPAETLGATDLAIKTNGYPAGSTPVTNAEGATIGYRGPDGAALPPPMLGLPPGIPSGSVPVRDAAGLLVGFRTPEGTTLPPPVPPARGP